MKDITVEVQHTPETISSMSYVQYSAREVAGRKDHPGHRVLKARLPLLGLSF